MRGKPVSITVGGVDVSHLVSMVELGGGERTWRPSPEWLAEAVRDVFLQCAPALGVHQCCEHDPRGRTA